MSPAQQYKGAATKINRVKQAHIRTLGINALVAALAESAAVHGRATEEGDYKLGNLHAKRIIAIENELTRRGPEAQRAVLALLDHEDVGVRASAAGYAVAFAPDKAKPVLEQIAAIPNSLVAFTVGRVLRTWHQRRPSPSE